jgi:hypothetical protein
MRVRLFPAVHGHIADSVRDHGPGLVAHLGGSFGTGKRSERFTEPLAPGFRCPPSPVNSPSGSRKITGGSTVWPTHGPRDPQALTRTLRISGVSLWTEHAGQQPAPAWSAHGLQKPTPHAGRVFTATGLPLDRRELRWASSRTGRGDRYLEGPVMAGAIEERLRRSTPPLPPQTSPAKPRAADADVERAEGGGARIGSTEAAGREAPAFRLT